jgi:hypothetical protein
MLKLIHMGRRPLYLIEPLLIILINESQLTAAQNAKNKVTFAKIAAIINVKDVFGGDQDTLPLTVKQRIAIGEKQNIPTPNIDHGDTVLRQGNNDGRPFTNGQE